MHTSSQLDTSKTYVWFISNIETRAIKGKPTLIIDWECKEHNVKVREYMRVCTPFAGSRLWNTMKCLGWDEQESSNTPPQTFFVKGLHVKAKPVMYWSELNSEDMKWKLNYETLEPMNEKVQTINPEDMKTLVRLCSHKGSRDAVLAHLATHRLELLEPFIELSKQGAFKFEKQT